MADENKQEPQNEEELETLDQSGDGLPAKEENTADKIDDGADDDPQAPGSDDTDDAGDDDDSDTGDADTVGDLRAQLARQSKQIDMLMGKLLSRDDKAPATEPKPKLKGDELLELITERGADGLEEVLASAGYVRTSDLESIVEKKLGEFGQNFTAGFVRDTQILDEFPELKKNDPNFMEEAKVLINKFKELGPEAGALYLAASAVRARQSAKAKPDADAEQRLRVAAGGRNSRRPTADKSAAPQFSPGMTSVLKQMGIKV